MPVSPRWTPLRSLRRPTTISSPASRGAGRFSAKSDLRRVAPDAPFAGPGADRSAAVQPQPAGAELSRFRNRKVYSPRKSAPSNDSRWQRLVMAITRFPKSASRRSRRASSMKGVLEVFLGALGLGECVSFVPPGDELKFLHRGRSANHFSTTTSSATSANCIRARRWSATLASRAWYANLTWKTQSLWFHAARNDRGADCERGRGAGEWPIR